MNKNVTHPIFDQKLIIFFDQVKNYKNNIALINVPDSINHQQSCISFTSRMTNFNRLIFGKIILLQNIESCQKVADHWATVYQQNFPDEYFEIWRQTQRLETHISWKAEQSINQDIIQDMHRKAISMTKRWPGLTVSFPEEGHMTYQISSNSEHAQKIQTLTFRWAERHMEKWGIINNIEKKYNEHPDCQPVMLTNQKINMEKKLQKIANDDYQESTAKNKQNMPLKIRFKV